MGSSIFNCHTTMDWGRGHTELLISSNVWETRLFDTEIRDNWFFVFKEKSRGGVRKRPGVHFVRRIPPKGKRKGWGKSMREETVDGPSSAQHGTPVKKFNSNNLNNSNRVKQKTRMFHSLKNINRRHGHLVRHIESVKLDSLILRSYFQRDHENFKKCQK